LRNDTLPQRWFASSVIA